MAIEKKLIHFGKLADFEAQLTAGNILDRSIVFIQDAKKIWTHGTYYDCSEGTEVPDSVYVTDFTVNDLLNLVETPDSVLSADFQSMYEAMVAHKVVLVPYDPREGFAGYGIANGYMEDLFYFSVKIEGGRCIEVEVNDYSQLQSDDLYIATYVREERLRTINGQTLLGDGDITVGGEDNVQSDWNVTDSSSDAYIKNKPIIPTNVSQLNNDRGLVDEQFARENFIGRSEDLSGMEVALIDQFLTPYGSLLYAFPDTANGDEDDVLLSRNTVKTINGESILGEGDITIDGGSLTESDIAAMGFTKNTGTYSKPSTGIPKSDLASAVQTSLSKADTALQSYTEQYKGTVTGVKINGTTKNPSSGVVDLGTVITAHQTLKTINGQSIVGSGDITISGGVSENYVNTAIANAITTTLNTAV